MVEELRDQIRQRDSELEAKAVELEELNKKTSEKFNKVKAQAKAKIKALEEELEELKKVCSFACWVFAWVEWEQI